MERIWEKVEEFRKKFNSLKTGQIPVDVFSLVELDLKLDVIPFDDLVSKYQAEAALRADFTGIYVDGELYHDLETAPEWKLKRLRFSLAHEVGHYVLHQDIPKGTHFSSLDEFSAWTSSCEGEKQKLEIEANEFAGRLLVPVDRLREFYTDLESKFAKEAVPQLKDYFVELIAEKFGVNSRVVSIRLDRENIWLAS